MTALSMSTRWPAPSPVRASRLATRRSLPSAAHYTAPPLCYFVGSMPRRSYLERGRRGRDGRGVATLRIAADNTDGDTAAPTGLRLVMYTKSECPLCDGLQEKLEALMQQGQFMPTALSGATLELRDITTEEKWMQAYAMAVPVLYRIDESGKEIPIPRPSPRVSAERLLKHIEKALA